MRRFSFQPEQVLFRTLVFAFIYIFCLNEPRPRPSPRGLKIELILMENKLVFLNRQPSLSPGFVVYCLIESFLELTGA